MKHTGVKIFLGISSLVGLILGYRYYFTVPKTYILDINKDTKTITYKIGLNGKHETISVNQVNNSKDVGYNNEVVNQYTEKIRNGILRITCSPDGSTMKFSTFSEDDTKFLFYTMVYIDIKYWEASDGSMNQPTYEIPN